MSTIQRRNSQRLASALEALSSDLGFQASEIDVTSNEQMTPEKYLSQDIQGRDYDSTQYLGEQDEEGKQFQDAIGSLEDDSDDDDFSGCEGSIEEGDLGPSIDDVGSEQTFDTSAVRDEFIGGGFDSTDSLKESIRQVAPASKKARIKKLIARIENVANYLQAKGRKKLAYRLDIVCNNLEQKYSIK